MLKTKKEIAYAVGIVLALIAVIVVIAVGVHLRHRPAGTDATSSPAPAAQAAAADAQGIVNEKNTLSFETVQDGLRSMGFLETEEYYFTEVVSRSKLKELFHTGIPLPLTESSFIGTYEGTITAGVDFAAVAVETEQFLGKTQVRVTIPAPVLQEPNIDPDSFELYSEKTGIANPFSVSEYNDVLSELEAEVQQNALDRGVLDRAEEHAKQIIGNFVASLLSGTDYELTIVVD